MLKFQNSGFVKTCYEYVLGLRVQWGLGWSVVSALFGFRIGTGIGGGWIGRGHRPRLDKSIQSIRELTIPQRFQIAIPPRFPSYKQFLKARGKP